MKVYFLFLGLIFLLPVNTWSQHCPFDGGYPVVVHLTDAKADKTYQEWHDLGVKQLSEEKFEEAIYSFTRCLRLKPMKIKPPKSGDRNDRQAGN